MTEFVLDPQLEKDTVPVADIGLTTVRLMNDSRFAWLILVPRRVGVTEMHDLSPLDQTMLTFEITQMAEALKAMTGCDKINIGALGNMVPQLHVHVVARSAGDAAWPGPVWGSGAAVPYEAGEAEKLVTALADAL